MSLNSFFKYVKNRWNKVNKNKLYLTDELAIIGLGLGGEAGEVQENIKKYIRDDGFKLTKSRKENLILELGDVIHYWCRICQYFNISPEEVFEQNKIKLDKRDKERKNNGIRFTP